MPAWLRRWSGGLQFVAEATALFELAAGFRMASEGLVLSHAEMLQRCGKHGDALQVCARVMCVRCVVRPAATAHSASSEYRRASTGTE